MAGIPLPAWIDRAWACCLDPEPLDACRTTEHLAGTRGIRGLGHGRSECAFWGRNDTYSGDPSVPDEDGFTRTQNWGQVGRDGRAFLKSIGVDPKHRCNPTGGPG
jgi:hypothetical protein